MEYLLYFLSQLVLPFCFGVGVLVGQDFELVSEPVVLAVLTSAAVALTVRLRRGKESRWALAAPLFGLVNGVVMLIFLDWWGGILAAVAAVVCGWVIFFKSPEKLSQTLFQILYVLLTLGFCLLLPLFLFAQIVGSTTIHQEVTSPDGRYTARLVEFDGGATGGDSQISVRDNKMTLSVGFGRFVKEFTAYSGDWWEYEAMELTWQDENTLLINRVPYQVDAAALAGSR